MVAKKTIQKPGRESTNQMNDIISTSILKFSLFFNYLNNLN